MQRLNEQQLQETGVIIRGGENSSKAIDLALDLLSKVYFEDIPKAIKVLGFGKKILPYMSQEQINRLQNIQGVEQERENFIPIEDYYHGMTLAEFVNKVPAGVRLSDLERTNIEKLLHINGTPYTIIGDISGVFLYPYLLHKFSKTDSKIIPNVVGGFLSLCCITHTTFMSTKYNYMINHSRLIDENYCKKLLSKERIKPCLWDSLTKFVPQKNKDNENNDNRQQPVLQAAQPAR